MKNRREVKIVERTIEILSTPKKWTKGARARDKFNNHTGYYSSQAVCWCIDGAIEKAVRDANLTKRKGINSYWKIVRAICKVANLKFDIHSQDEHMMLNDAEETNYQTIINTLKKAKAFLKGE